MPGTTVDMTALYAALDRRRQAAAASWREVARDLDISPSTFTRLAQGRRPDVDTFATLLRWLGMPADAFMRPAAQAAIEQPPEPMVMISSYLRSARNLSEDDARALEDVIQAAYRMVTRHHEE